MSRLFSDNMILQQQTKNAIWGWANAGETVTVKASWGADRPRPPQGGRKWKLFLETPSHGTGHSLTISGENTIEIQNVAIGEVWLCAGQSNMGWSMGNSFEAEKEADVDLPDFRILQIGPRTLARAAGRESRPALSMEALRPRNRRRRLRPSPTTSARNCIRNWVSRWALSSGPMPERRSKAGCRGRFRKTTRAHRHTSSSWMRMPSGESQSGRDDRESLGGLRERAGGIQRRNRCRRNDEERVPGR